MDRSLDAHQGLGWLGRGPESDGLWRGGQEVVDGYVDNVVDEGA